MDKITHENRHFYQPAIHVKLLFQNYLKKWSVKQVNPSSLKHYKSNACKLFDSKFFTVWISSEIIYQRQLFENVYSY